MNKFLKVNKTRILNSDNKPTVLKGVNFGGWLMTEGYILHAPNRAEQLFRKNFKRILGEKALAQFDEDFRGIFIREDDVKNVRQLGFNCIRIPFHYRVVESSPYKYQSKGLVYIDKIIRWAEKYKIWIILDLHAAPGAQNHDWHSDSLGQADFWKHLSYQKRVFALWEFLADRYKNKEWIAGYDLLNEAVLQDVKLLNKFYKNLIKLIRSVDRQHILFIEGNRWAQNLDCLEEIEDDHFVLSVHNYEPWDYTANVIPYLSYPFKGCNKTVIHQHLLHYKKISEKRGVPIYVGEFGVNYRDGIYGEQKWLKDVLECFEEFDFYWTYWTYKAIKNNCFPDGLYSYYPNPMWVNRAGPLMGWETYHLHWLNNRQEMIRSWRTQEFQVNPHLLRVLQNANF